MWVCMNVSVKLLVVILLIAREFVNDFDIETKSVFFRLRQQRIPVAAVVQPFRMDEGGFDKFCTVHCSLVPDTQLFTCKVLPHRGTGTKFCTTPFLLNLVI